MLRREPSQPTWEPYQRVPSEDGCVELEAVVIGGAALNLLGVVHRTTKDCDILHPALPQAVVEAAHGPQSLARALCSS